MNEALKEAKKALLEKEFPVGCVITYKDEIIARGRRKKSSGENPGEIDHAEINTIKYLHDKKPHLPKTEMTIYSTMEPCMMCFSAIMLSGFKKIVYAYEDVMGGGCKIPKKSLPEFYQKRYPAIVPDILRNTSIDLFKNFFSDPCNTYWKDSPLFTYTLSL